MLRVSDDLYLSRVAAQILHGGGARWNSGNRWFDKTLQVSLKERNDSQIQSNKQDSGSG